MAKRGSTFEVGMRMAERDGYLQMRQALQAIPDKVKTNSRVAAARNASTVVGRSREIFQSSIRRFGETGKGDDGRRQTGNFTFGKGKTFSPATFEVGRFGYGFGYPDIEQADAQTQGVWRVLEYGLKGTGVPGPSTRFPENNYLLPQGTHRLPRAFGFSSKNPATSFLFFGRRPTRDGSEGDIVKITRKRAGRGIEGKHFIDDAWLSSMETVAGRYKKAVTDAIASFK